MSHSRDNVSTEINYYKTKYHADKKLSAFSKYLISLNPTLHDGIEYDDIDKIMSILGNVKGKRICEIGCGEGGLANRMLQGGAYLSAIDIAEDVIKVAQKRNQTYTPSRAMFSMMDACNLSFKDKSFDIVVGRAVLHHIDVIQAAKEASRVLKKGGRAIFVEPLAHNPIANLWRMLTPTERTKNEYPLSYQDIKNMSRYFKSVKYEEFNLLPLFSALVMAVTFSEKLKAKSYAWLNKVEPRFLKIFKPLKKYSAQVVIEFVK
jgi:ubiquinone/menaquinone biosynthesis C-methylase UbiE